MDLLQLSRKHIEEDAGKYWKSLQESDEKLLAKELKLSEATEALKKCRAIFENYATDGQGEDTVEENQEHANEISRVLKQLGEE